MDIEAILQNLSPNGLLNKAAFPPMTSQAGSSKIQSKDMISSDNFMCNEKEVLTTHESEISYKNYGNCREEQSYEPVTAQNSADQGGIFAQSFGDYQDHSYEQFTSKQVKKSATSTQVQVQTETSEAISKKQKKNAKNTQESVPNKTELNLTFPDVSLKNLVFDLKFKSKKEFLLIEVNTSNLPECLQNAKIEEAKNFLKTIGDCFLDHVYRNDICDPTKLKKDCMSSLPIWNAFFDESLRSDLGKRKDLKKLMAGLIGLKEVTTQTWLSIYLDFFTTFDQSDLRSKGQKDFTKLLYELLAKNMIKGAWAIKSITDAYPNLVFKTFALEKVHKTKSIFRLETDSAKIAKQLADQHTKRGINVSLQTMRSNLTENLSMTEESPSNMLSDEQLTQNVSVSSNLDFFERMEEVNNQILASFVDSKNLEAVNAPFDNYDLIPEDEERSIFGSISESKEEAQESFAPLNSEVSKECRSESTGRDQECGGNLYGSEFIDYSQPSNARSYDL